MRTGISITVSANARRQLEAVVADRNAAQKYVWRSPIVLLTADGLGTSAIMAATGKSGSLETVALYVGIHRRSSYGRFWVTRPVQAALVCVVA